MADQRTIETYNGLAEAYDHETAGFWERFPSGVLDAFTEATEGPRVLDDGSGPGRDGLLLKDRGFDVTCLDASAVMAGMCRARGLNALVGDFSELPFADGAFDGVWAYTSLLHVPKDIIGPSLAEIRRVLRSGGTFGLGMIEGDTEGYRESAGVDKPRWFSYYGEQELYDLLAQYGFGVTYFEIFTPRKSNYLNFICQKR